MKRRACLRERGTRKKRVCKDGAGMGKKMAQVKLACRSASARLNTDDVVVGCPRFPTTPCNKLV